MNKTFKSYVGIWAILLVLFNIIAFVSVGWINYDKYTASFWVGYSFITLAFVGQIFCAKIAFNAENLKKMFLNISILSISYTGLIFTFIFGGLCMLISPLPYWVGVILNAIVLALTAISVIKSTVAIDAVENVEKKVKSQTAFIKLITSEAESVMTRALTPEAKAECKRVYEAFRYSDPMSTDALSGIEGQISIKFNEFSQAVSDSNIDKIKTLANEVVILAGDRNKKCKVLK